LELSEVHGVTAAPGSGYYAVGSDVVITATPANVIWWGDTNGCTIGATSNVLTCPMTQVRHIAVGIAGQPIEWDAGGADTYWTTAKNWSDDMEPHAGFDYVVTGGTYTCRGPNGGATFAGDSLTVTNGAELELYRYSGGGYPTSAYTIPNLAIQNAGIESFGGFGGYRNRLSTKATFTGDSTIKAGWGSGYHTYFYLDDGIAGSGTIDCYVNQGNYNGIGRQIYLAGDYSGYSGDWTVRKSTGTNPDRLVGLYLDDASGWGTGALAVGYHTLVTFNVSVEASNSDVTMTADALMHIGDDLANTVRSLTVDGAPIPGGTYTAAQLNTATASTQFSGDALTNGTLRILRPTSGTTLLVR